MILIIIVIKLYIKGCDKNLLPSFYKLNFNISSLDVVISLNDDLVNDIVAKLTLTKNVYCVVSGLKHFHLNINMEEKKERNLIKKIV